MRFGLHVRPAPQTHGWVVKPPHGPSSPETHATGGVALVRSAPFDSVGSEVPLAPQAATVSPANSPHTNLAMEFMISLSGGRK
jgi:hypothetical protein